MALGVSSAYRYWTYGSQSASAPVRQDVAWGLKSYWFTGSQPSYLKWSHSDRDAFYGTNLGFGIIQLLQNTGKFDEVLLVSKPELSRSTMDGYFVAMIVPLPAAHQQDGSQQVATRTVRYSLVLEVIMGDPENAVEELDKLEGSAINVLTNPTNRRYGGFVYPWTIRLERNDMGSRKNPTRQRWLTGQFAYTYYANAGLSEREPWQP